MSPDTSNLRWPFFGPEERAAVDVVLASGRVNQWTGERVVSFEAAFAERMGAPHSVAVFNGSVALELALIALGIGPGDEVIVAPRSFVASASSVSLVGATPVFADVDPDSQLITPATVEPLIGPRTRAILPVHLAGWPADMPGLMALAREHGLKVIEDCAQAHGARIDGRCVGSFGDAAAFSFCQDKIMTTGGEGGMVLFQDRAAARRAWSYKDHGKDWNLTHPRVRSTEYQYVHHSLGTNWRMIEIQAAIGLVQLGKLDGWLSARAAHATVWRRHLEGVRGLRVPRPGNGIEHAYYRLYAFLEPTELREGTTRHQVASALNAAGIAAASGSCSEIYRERAFAELAVAERPVARRLGETALTFEVHPRLTPAEIETAAAEAAAIIASFAR